MWYFWIAGLTAYFELAAAEKERIHELIPLDIIGMICLLMGILWPLTWLFEILMFLTHIIKSK